MSAENQIRMIAPLPAGFRMTPEWHRARAAFLRWLDDADTRWLAQQHENVAKAIDYRRQRPLG
jgi:hypothetical protein